MSFRSSGSLQYFIWLLVRRSDDGLALCQARKPAFTAAHFSRQVARDMLWLTLFSKGAYRERQPPQTFCHRTDTGATASHTAWGQSGSPSACSGWCGQAYLLPCVDALLSILVQARRLLLAMNASEADPEHLALMISIASRKHALPVTSIVVKGRLPVDPKRLSTSPRPGRGCSPRGCPW